MKNKTMILGYFLISIFFTIGCSKPIQPTYLGYQNLRLGKVGTKSNVLMSDIKFYNPNKYALNVKDQAKPPLLWERIRSLSACA